MSCQMVFIDEDGESVDGLEPVKSESPLPVPNAGDRIVANDSRGAEFVVLGHTSSHMGDLATTYVRVRAAARTE